MVREPTFAPDGELSGFLQRLQLFPVTVEEDSLGFIIDASIFFSAKPQDDGFAVYSGERKLSSSPDALFNHAEDAGRYLLAEAVASYRESTYPGWRQPIPDGSQLPEGFELTAAGSFSKLLQWEVAGDQHRAMGFGTWPAAIRFSFVARWTLQEIYDSALLP